MNNNYNYFYIHHTIVLANNNRNCDHNSQQVLFLYELLLQASPLKSYIFQYELLLDYLHILHHLKILLLSHMENQHTLHKS